MASVIVRDNDVMKILNKVRHIIGTSLSFCMDAYAQGAAEMVLELCTHYVNEDGDIQEITPEYKQETMEKIQSRHSFASECSSFWFKQWHLVD